MPVAGKSYVKSYLNISNNLGSHTLFCPQEQFWAGDSFRKWPCSHCGRNNE